MRHGTPASSASAKIGLQMKRRFWEQDEQIYGGITSTDQVIARTLQRLDARGAVYASDADGDLVGRWDSHPFWFMTIGRAKEHLEMTGARPGQAAWKVTARPVCQPL